METKLVTITEERKNLVREHVKKIGGSLSKEFIEEWKEKCGSCAFWTGMRWCFLHERPSGSGWSCGDHETAEPRDL